MKRLVDQPNSILMHCSNWSFHDVHRSISYLCSLILSFLLFLCHLLNLYLYPLILFPCLFSMVHGVWVVVPLQRSHGNTICRVALLSMVVYSNRDDRLVDIIHNIPFFRAAADDDHHTQYICVHSSLYSHIRNNTYGKKRI